jgi:ABC-type multidrug transport system fused ATPase/permease subunit
LLFRFLEPQSGTIGINRRPLSELPQKYLFSQIALMEQHPAFFSDSLRDNLTLGNETIGEDRIGDVLRRTDMDPVRDRLPGGLGSRIGVEGRHLSGGERQRLAFARTLLYARPVMIFDEPLAHLNPELAEKLLSAIIALRQGHIVLLISHQPRYLEKTDQILVMDQGKIAERGTYSELMARQEYFYAITRAQRGKNLDI